MNTTATLKVDGMEYQLDVTSLTGREVGVLKRIGHIRGINDIPEAIGMADLEVLAALTGIAMQRAGHMPDYDKLLDLPLGDIEFQWPEDDEKRPTQAGEESKTPAPPGVPDSPECTG